MRNFIVKMKKETLLEFLTIQYGAEGCTVPCWATKSSELGRHGGKAARKRGRTDLEASSAVRFTFPPCQSLGVGKYLDKPADQNRSGYSPDSGRPHEYVVIVHANTTIYYSDIIILV